MSFLEKIMNREEEEEVKLDPSNQKTSHRSSSKSRDIDTGSGEVKLSEDNSEDKEDNAGGFLPGMSSQEDSTSSSRTDSAGTTLGTSSNNVEEGGEKLDRIIKQNERIIELLEKIGDFKGKDPNSEELW
ncbi:MAG: hypothetical protein MUP58_02270 [Candidatus Nanohaloarchaeota archaeon QJJ-9]|nr:hypothetical protein [Candidatus Nanohaloarchaeota archaeon QJJ-9]